MLGTGTPLDPAMVYFDARLSRSYPTVEIRVADVCQDVDDTVLLAALARASSRRRCANGAAGYRLIRSAPRSCGWRPGARAGTDWTVRWPIRVVTG
jgi:carboxylate-amine ligase